MLNKSKNWSLNIYIKITIKKFPDVCFSRILIKKMMA